ncbi:choice-of-anchor D domain-containing protein [Bowmanella dokdonensis]|uniref:Choice-of-anchor D domain-containing protein n=1 Tax=Bowmanella dokdonensis TaxID=751969 RepID=A0A939INQ0_9ALTE|nr:choice-of-anchor D domain-containing protein [Bowmanella dokdonensis]MBN7826588.1 choice-of-anchor D domain-containing protein [Bowmanella dokdonensis]
MSKHQARYLLLAGGLLSSLITSAETLADTIFSEDFSSGDISGWNTSGTVDAYNNESIRLRGPSWAQLPVSTSGYSQIQISLSLAAGSLENGEFCYAEYSADAGTTWTTIQTVANGQDNGTVYSNNLSQSQMDNNPNLMVRFRGDGSTVGDYCYGQSVQVSGNGGAPTAPDLDAPSSVSFPHTEPGNSRDLVFQIGNAGTQTLQVSNVSQPASPFALLSQNCAQVSPGTQCQVELRFSPVAEGNFNDSIMIESDDPDEGQWLVSLSGNASQSGTVDNFDPLTGSGAVPRSQLTYSQLINATDPGTLLDFAAFALPADAAMPGNLFSGRLTLLGEAAGGAFDEHKDSFRYTGSQDTSRKHLPEFDFEYVQTGSHIFPLARGSIASSHPEWEYILSPGRVWQENGDNGYSRVALPFALQQKNANCVHNGVFSFLFKNDGAISKVAYQIASETCLYFQVDMWGRLDASYTALSFADANQQIAAYQAEVLGRLPTKPLSALAQDFPGTDVQAFSAPGGKDPQDMSLVGFVIDGIHYTGGCSTRQGTYPYCESLVVPSYSAAKSAFAGSVLMRLEQKYPGSFNRPISNHVTACDSNGNWSDVSFGNALDMATGNYALAGYMSDEGASHTNGLFLVEDHASKISYSCTQYSRKASPGTQWVYHTSDTYILGTAMNDYLQSLEGTGKDIHTDILLTEILQPLQVSPTSGYTRRTYDGVQQPFTGWGLIWLRDDIAKIGQFFAGSGQSLLDPTELNAALQRDPLDRGLEPLSQFKYNNGFWARDVSDNITDCNQPPWVPFMSGYGGITVLILPNNSLYYYFSDDDSFVWMDAAVEAHQIRSFCQ